MARAYRHLVVLVIFAAATLSSSGSDGASTATRAGSIEQARREAQRVMNAGLPFVEKMLAEYGEFVPFGAAMRPEGLIQNLAADEGQEREPVERAYERLLAGLREGAANGDYKAVAVFALVKLPHPEDGTPITAVHVALEHRDGYCADVFFPAVHEGKSVVLGDSFAGKREGEFFGKCR